MNTGLRINSFIQASYSTRPCVVGALENWRKQFAVGKSVANQPWQSAILRVHPEQRAYRVFLLPAAAMGYPGGHHRLNIPKLRKRGCFPTFPEPRRIAGKALMDIAVSGIDPGKTVCGVAGSTGG